MPATTRSVSVEEFEPPMLLVCTNRRSATGACVTRTRRFAVKILGEQQGELAGHFAAKSPDKFRDLETSTGCFDEPLLDGALAHVECRVVEEVSAGTHAVFLAEVERASAGAGSPLAYYRGQFGRLELEADERAYATLRALVVARRLPVGAPLDVTAITRNADLPPAAAHQALTRLTHDHVSIVEAYEAGDLSAANDAIRRDYLRALRFNLERLRAAGGSI